MIASSFRLNVSNKPDSVRQKPRLAGTSGKSGRVTELVIFTLCGGLSVEWTR